MSVIKKGYADKPTYIKIYARPGERSAELWIEQEGVQSWLLGRTLKQVEKGEKYKDFTVVQDDKGNRFVQGEAITKIDGQETLAYMTLEELLHLRDECNVVIQELVK
jgi:hypothetical protein